MGSPEGGLLALLLQKRDAVARHRSRSRFQRLIVNARKAAAKIGADLPV